MHETANSARSASLTERRRQNRQLRTSAAVEVEEVERRRLRRAQHRLTARRESDSQLF